MWKVQDSAWAWAMYECDENVQKRQDYVRTLSCAVHGSGEVRCGIVLSVVISICVIELFILVSHMIVLVFLVVVLVIHLTRFS